MLKRFVVLLVMASMVLAFSAFTASAGEINGKGERPMVVETVDTPEGDFQILHARSECAFSGLNDEYLLGLPSDGFGRTQNWGQIPKGDRDFLKSVGFNPGVACNPIKSDGGHP
ncbi:MAG: hypothetical protein KJN63_05065 [Acidimicrobiia bacterium]|nr:hypothetical protein [Acidimicrobiia bacterium]